MMRMSVIVPLRNSGKKTKSSGKPFNICVYVKLSFVYYRCQYEEMQKTLEALKAQVAVEVLNEEAMTIEENNIKEVSMQVIVYI